MRHSLLDMGDAFIKRWSLTWLILLAAVVPAAAEKPCSLVRNGGCDSPAAWDVVPGSDDRQLVPIVGSDYTGFVKEPAPCPPATIVEGGNPGKCLRVVGPGVATQEFLAPAGSAVALTATVDVGVNDVSTQPGKGGYAYATVAKPMPAAACWSKTTLSAQRAPSPGDDTAIRFGCIRMPSSSRFAAASPKRAARPASTIGPSC